ncbi:GbNV_gp19-like protein [Carcinus maenas nudivirus]|uniref:GbNV_gp19-like protein n=1 Tax=Carcinus maenas nudivirus TaxID=2880837 RepID=A0AAE9BZ81_9VIRU|nr:GbNV_gp19-like protein [Carcinus maenas nudivirus]UBZ25677.1 GbNV_gp19-like protein [Carcinus maenas nudivirus]
MEVNAYIVVTSVLAIILLILCIYIISIIVYPKKPIEYLKKTLDLNPNSEYIYDDCTSYETFESPNTHMKHKIFYLEKDNTTGIIIIDLPGGAFLSSSNTLVPYKYINQPHTVVSLEYPVLPQGRMTTALNYLYDAITYVLDKFSNPKIIMSAASAGVFYATKIINSEKFTDSIIKFISTSGYFGYKTLENIATIITDKIYLRKLSKSTLNDCVPILPHISTLFVIGELDAMKSSTIEFLKQSGAENEAIEYPNADHCFYLRYNNEITKGYYADVGNFIVMT